MFTFLGIAGSNETRKVNNSGLNIGNCLLKRF